MAVNQDRINTRSGYGLLAGVIIASLALGLIVWKVGNYEWQSIIYVVFIVTGIYLALISFKADSGLDFAPSDSAFFLVIGVLLATVGGLGFAAMLTSIDTWILVAIFILVFAVLITYRSVSRKG